MGLFGVVGALSGLAAAWMSNHDFNDDAPNVTSATGAQKQLELKANRANRKRLSMLCAFSLACLTVVVGYILLFWKVGTITREVDDVVTNWSAFVTFGVAGAAMMVFHTYFLNQVSLLASIVAAVLWGGSIAALGVATLPHHGYKRWLIAGLAVVAQAVGVASLFFGSVHMPTPGAKRPFYTLEAWFVIMIALFGFVLYDVAFFTGYWNLPSDMVEMGKHWKGDTLVFSGNVLFFLAVGFLGLILVDVDEFSHWLFRGAQRKIGSEMPLMAEINANANPFGAHL
jgi:hypothetical protein